MPFCTGTGEGHFPELVGRFMLYDLSDYRNKMGVSRHYIS